MVRCLTMSRSDPPSRVRPRRLLTPREQQVLQCVWNGLTNREIANVIGVQTATVEAHRASIMRKIGVRNTAQLIKAAVEENLIVVR